VAEVLPGRVENWQVPHQQPDLLAKLEQDIINRAVAARLCGWLLEAEGPLVVFIPLFAGVVRDHPDLSSAGVFRLAWGCGM
jgi:hypothetical protein